MICDKYTDRNYVRLQGVIEEIIMTLPPEQELMVHLKTSSSGRKIGYAYPRVAFKGDISIYESLAVGDRVRIEGYLEARKIERAGGSYIYPSTLVGLKLEYVNCIEEAMEDLAEKIIIQDLNQAIIGGRVIEFWNPNDNRDVLAVRLEIEKVKGTNYPRITSFDDTNQSLKNIQLGDFVAFFGHIRTNLRTINARDGGQPINRFYQSIIADQAFLVKTEDNHGKF